MSTGSAQQTSTTTAGVSPFAQNYVDAMLGAGQQQVFNMTPGEGGKMNITGIKPYIPFGAPMNAQGNVVPYGGQPQGMGWGAYGGGYGQPSGGFEGDTIGDGFTKAGPGMSPQEVQQRYGSQDSGLQSFAKMFGGAGAMPGVGGGPSSMVYTPEQAQQDAYLRSLNPNFRQQREAQIRSMEQQIQGPRQYSATQPGGGIAPYGPGISGEPEYPEEEVRIPEYDTWGGGFQPYPQYQQPNTGYPTGTMQAGMGPGEQIAARSAVAGPSALQQQAYRTASGMQVPGQYGTATDIGQTAGLGLLNTAGQAQGLMSLAQQAVQQGRQYGQDITDPNRTAQFMSPYMQNVVNAQQREAARQSGILGTQQAGQAVKSGAFGGSRAGLLEAERQRNLATQLGDIQATGLQSAFQNAQQQQMNAQQQAMQGLTSGMSGYGQGIQGQTGAYGQAMQGAGTLSNIGGQQLGSQQSIANLQNQFGQQQQQNQQQVINQAIQNYLMQKQYPQQQLQWMSSMLSGLPVSSTGQVTNIPAPNLTSQIAGLGTAGVGAYMLGDKLKLWKKGGEVKSTKGGNGLMDLALSKMGA